MYGDRYILPSPEVFWARVSTAADDECWPWKDGLGSHGYGQINLRLESGRWVPTTAHRVAYALAHDIVLDGHEVRHSCDNPPCCNPQHLMAGPGHQENAADMVARNRQSRGEHRPASKLTEADVLAIRAAKGTTVARLLAERHGVGIQTIWKIWQRRSWRHI